MDTTSIQSNIEAVIMAAINDLDDEALAELDVMLAGMAYFPERDCCLISGAFTDANWSDPAFTIPWEATHGPGFRVMLPAGTAIDYETLDSESDELEQMLSDEVTLLRLAPVIRRELLANVPSAVELLIDPVRDYLSEQD